MIVSEAYRPNRAVSVCRDHYYGVKPLPADAPSLGAVQDARDDIPCEFCDADMYRVNFGDGRVSETFSSLPRARECRRKAEGYRDDSQALFEGRDVAGSWIEHLVRGEWKRMR